MNTRVEIFFFLNQCLAPNSTKKEIAGLKQKIVTEKIDWLEIIKVANLHLVVPALWFGLENKGLTKTLDEELVGYLKGCHHLNLERNRFLKQRLTGLISAFNAIDLEPVLFKGSATLFDSLFPDLGIRIMTDIDLLFRECDLDKAITALTGMGYRQDMIQYEKYGELDYVKKGKFRK